MKKFDQIVLAVQAVSKIRGAMGFRDRGLEQDREDVTSAYERIQREARREDCRWETGPVVERIESEPRVISVPTDYVNPAEAPLAMRKVA